MNCYIYKKNFTTWISTLIEDRKPWSLCSVSKSCFKLIEIRRTTFNINTGQNSSSIFLSTVWKAFLLCQFSFNGFPKVLDFPSKLFHIWFDGGGCSTWLPVFHNTCQEELCKVNSTGWIFKNIKFIEPKPEILQRNKILKFL